MNCSRAPRFQLVSAVRLSGPDSRCLPLAVSRRASYPIKKREKMIEVLQSCWEAKHQSNTNTTSQTAVDDVPDEELEVATHGDILSKAHGLATRPTPKVVKKKTPRPKDKSATPAKPARRKAAEDDEDVGKTPKQRKRAEPKAKEPEKSKADKARKSKA